MAAEASVLDIDTASTYGNSEEILGRLLPRDVPWRLVTKTPALGERDGPALLHETIIKSLEHLRRDTLYGLLFHRSADISGPCGIGLVESALTLKRRGIVQKLGVSVYSGNEIDSVLKIFTPDIVQLPVNLADRRLIESGHLAKLKEQGVEIHARSLFLQGALLMSPDRLPTHFQDGKPLFQFLCDSARKRGLTMLEACLAFGFSQSLLDCLVLGVNSHTEFKEYLAAARRMANMRIDFELPVFEERFINPASWNID
ncbi:Aldo/keto reductase family protein [Rhodospirillaceae bacterium LM-1]|nr:Aldo/keto reductase family protein [Rhodospirillaceae bacterium LM-1]